VTGAFRGDTLFNVLRQNVSGATLFQLAVELSWLFIAILLVVRLMPDKRASSTRTSH
jgi:hypothetical protein